MYYTGINPMNGKSVYVTTDYHEKQLQRALLQYSKPENANLVREALRLAGREDLIGNSPECLVRPSFSGGRYLPDKKPSRQSRSSPSSHPPRKGSQAGHPQRPATKKGKSKFDRIFGEDADRIRREADRMSSAKSKGGAKKPSQSKDSGRTKKNKR